MKFSFFQSIRSRLLGIAFIAVIPALVFNFIIFIGQYRSVRTSAEDDLRAALDATAVYHSGQYDLAHQALTFLANEAYRDTTNVGCGERLAEAITGQSLFLNFFITDLEGNVICTAVPTTEHISVADRAYFSDTLRRNDFTVGEYVVGRIVNTPVLIFAHPYNDNGGTVKGIVGASLDISTLSRVIETLDLFEGASLIVTDNTGTIIMQYPDGLIGVPIDPSLQEYIKLPGSGFVEATGSDGQERLFAYISLGNGQEFVADSMPLENITYKEHRTIARMALLTLLILSGIWVLAWVGSTTLVLRKLRQLAMIVRRIGNGELDTRYETKLGGEFDELGEIINSMATRLQESRERDERQVAQLQDALQELNKFKFAVARSSDHIVVTDPDGKIIFANQGVERITGYSPEEVIGKTPRLWGGQMSQEFYEKLWHTIKDEKKIFTGEITNKRKNGELYEAAASITPVLDAKGNVQFFVGVERDITEQKRLDRAKSEFISIAAHQLRTPVSAMRWLIESVQHSLKGKVQDQKQATYIKDLYTMTERLARLVEDLLNISRMEIGTYKVQGEEFDLGPFIGKSVKELQIYAAGKDHKVEFNPPKESMRVSVASNLVNTVFSNLVSNAIDYSPKDTTVTISLEKDGSYAKTSITNTGPAISKEEQEKLFTRFYRGKRGKQINPEGSGLGLYIVKTFVERMGGTVGVSSNEDKTVFWFTLPLV